MKRFHMTLISGTIDYALLEYDEEDYKKARCADNELSITISGGIGNVLIGKYVHSGYKETHFKAGYTSLGNFFIINNTCQFFEGFKPCKTEEVVAVRTVSEFMKKETIVQQISIAIVKLQKIPKSPYRDCIEKYYTDMKKFVESVEVDE